MKQYIKFIKDKQFPLFGSLDEMEQVFSNEVSKLNDNGYLVDSIFRCPLNGDNYGIIYHKQQPRNDE